ncbi:hypothetical protein SEA_DUMPTRUCK_36 [Gordonia phage DumpTruck]|nr:hypothetical protein SEA_DUMPTRUCK_36 [Gordonia phage DumpTruck]
MSNDLLVPILTALITSGTLWSIIKGISKLPQNRNHQKKVWEELTGKAYEYSKKAVDEENAKLVERLSLAEETAKISNLKRDLMTNFCGLMLDDLEELGASSDKMNAQRELLRQINYTDTLDELLAIRIRSI